MPAPLSVRVTAGCSGGGSGTLTVNVLNAPVGETVTVNMVSLSGNHTVTLVPPAIQEVVYGVLNDIYGVSVSSPTESSGDVFINGENSPSLDKELAVNCSAQPGGGGSTPGDTCDVQINGIVITPGDGESATTATVNATGTGTLEYNLNNGAFQSSNVFTVTPGIYIATVRKDDESCSAVTSFVVSAPNALSVIGPGRDWLPVGQPIYYTFQSPDAEPLPLEIEIQVSTNGVNFNGTTSAGTIVLPPDTNGQYRVNVAPYLEAMFEPGTPAMAGTDYKLFRLYRLQAGSLFTPDAHVLYAMELSPIQSGLITLSREPYAFNSASFPGLKTAVDVAANTVSNAITPYSGPADLCPKHPIQLYWLNRWGGWQTWVFDGKHEQEQDVPQPSEWKDENNRVHRGSFEGITESINVYSGFIPLTAYDTVFSILSAIRVYTREQGVWREVNIEPGSYQRDKRGQRRKELNFSFTYSQQTETQRA